MQGQVVEVKGRAKTGKFIIRASDGGTYGAFESKENAETFMKKNGIVIVEEEPTFWSYEHRKGVKV